jgi:hypothetical protein
MQTSFGLSNRADVTAIRNLHVSAFLVAMALFGMLNLFLGYKDSVGPFTKLSLDAVHFDFSGTESSAEKLSFAPNLVLAGSSLFLYPMWRIDKSDGANAVDSNHYHYAKSLDRQFAKRNVAVTTYSLATGGAMMSDSYLLLVHYLRKHHPAPQYVILDCAPRSFYDSGMFEPDATSVFQWCFNPTDFLLLGHEYLPSLSMKLNYWGCKLCFMYQHRRSLSENIVHGSFKPTWKSDFNPLGSFQAESQKSTDPKVKSVSPIVNDIGAGTPARFEYSLQDYKGRYFLINLYQMEKQLHFLKQITSLCASHNIKLIVVNMPLTHENLSLLPDGFYDDFKRVVKASISGNAVYVDLNEKLSWPKSLYSDSVHLNDQGAEVLNEKVVDAVAGDRTVPIEKK